MTLATNSSLSWFGSDSEVAGLIASLMNHCRHVTIPFCGGLSILPHLTARAVVANDLNSLAINFYRVAGGVWGEECQKLLFERCQHTLSHPDELEQAKADRDSADRVDRAWAMWASCWIARKGKGGTAGDPGLPSVRRTASGGTNASRIRAAANDLPEWARHFERCEWQQVDFRELLPSVADDPSCGVYCDPPWIGPGDQYLHPFRQEDHFELAMLLGRFEHTTVVVRYGDTPFIRELYAKNWRIIPASSRTQSNAVTNEIWITNRQAA